MTLFDDSPDAQIKTLNRSIFPKGTKGHIVGCRFIEGLTERVYNFQTTEDINGLAKGAKSAWYLDRDLINVIDD